MIKVFFSTISLLLFLACGGENHQPQDLFAIKLEGDKKQFQQNESIDIGLDNKLDKTIKSVRYSIDGKELTVSNNSITFDIPTLGNKTLKAVVDYDETSVEISKNIKILAEKAPELYTYEIIKEYPHDNRAYTQGLEFYQDTLYESTGKKGRSSLRKVDYKTGKVLKQIDLDNTIFGEGMTILNGKIYQLTWQSHIGYVYDLKDFKKIDSFQYGESKEGWGLANDGEKLFKSDGTENIWFLNPETLVEEGHTQTVTNSSIFNKTNELEYVAGKLYANVYQKSGVMIIDAKSGAIEGVVNFGGLSKKVTKTPNWVDTDNVLNGIAYHPTRKTFFVTGKDWDKLFEVKIIKK
ncbi:glutaminyl-peptide cyclotransferase [Maribacter algarum]|uniref:Glutaminyl-peptide cyclotransferase n=1 Tax=Maribacter algarum (ex Zhang et al. 2020) TaxID=2578118 RepID=A0A5S3PQK0_9FLAO|nr:glutaminyl-peptide cyclotransferase [Maribacter algarum]TMM56941.1 glutaminyl-peptide cyclotransferase [Maribacter algarum]